MRGGRLPWSGRGSGRVQTGCCHQQCFSEQELARVGVSEATCNHTHHARGFGWHIHCGVEDLGARAARIGAWNLTVEHFYFYLERR